MSASGKGSHWPNSGVRIGDVKRPFLRRQSQSFAGGLPRVSVRPKWPVSLGSAGKRSTSICREVRVPRKNGEHIIQPRRTFRLDGDTTRSSAGTLEMNAVTAIVMKRVSPIVIIYTYGVRLNALTVVAESGRFLRQEDRAGKRPRTPENPPPHHPASRGMIVVAEEPGPW